MVAVMEEAVVAFKGMGEASKEVGEALKELIEAFRWAGEASELL